MNNLSTKHTKNTKIGDTYMVETKKIIRMEIKPKRGCNVQKIL